MNNYIVPDDIIGRMHSLAEEAAVLVDIVESNYFQRNAPQEEDLLRIRLDYTKIGTTLQAVLELLRLAEAENIKWQQRPAEQIMQESEALNNSHEQLTEGE